MLLEFISEWERLEMTMEEKNKILHVFFQMQMEDMGKHTHMLLEYIKGLLLGKTVD